MTVIFSETAPRESELVPAVPADLAPSSLAALDDLQLLAIVGSLPRGSERRRRRARCWWAATAPWSGPACSDIAAVQNLLRTSCRRGMSA